MISNKIKIFLLEDSDEDISQLEEVLPSRHYEIIGIARSFDEATSLFERLEFDIAIIDIFLNGRPEGIRFAETIYRSNTKKPFIFLTSSIDKEVFSKAKMTDPSNYLIKPFNTPELLFAIELALERFLQKEGAFAQQQPVFYEGSFFARDGQSLVKVSYEDIKYATVEGPYCSLITERGDFILHTSLNRFMDELKNGPFIRSHRNFIVNLRKINKVYPNDNLILLSSGEKVLLSRRHKEEFFQRYKILK
ncbi:MAG: response regulator transcription factor [Bacteroidota bacterium]